MTCGAAGVGTDSGDNPRQDGRFGYDAKNAAGTLVKTGGGAAGFDFSKVCLNGDLASQGTCAADPQTTDANPWACTKDNRTNLIWSIESFSNKTWAEATDTAGGSLIDGYNTASRCGFATDWRVPTRRELLTIVHHGASDPAIDTTYFPSTASILYWTSDTYAPDPANAWIVGFSIGNTFAFDKSSAYYVRLVRSGQ